MSLCLTALFTESKGRGTRHAKTRERLGHDRGTDRNRRASNHRSPLSFVPLEKLFPGNNVLRALGEDQELAPQHLGRFEPYNIDIQSSKAYELWQTEASKPVGLLGGEFEHPLRIGLSVLFGMTHKQPFHSLFWNVDTEILKIERGVERIESLFHKLVLAFDAHWGAAFHSEDFERQNVLLNFRYPDGSIERYKIVGVNLLSALPGLYWLNFFGPVLCDFIGVKTIKAAASSTEPLGKGWIVKCSSSPTDMLDETIRLRADEIRSALGSDLFFDIRMPDRPTRAPVFSLPPISPPPPQPLIPKIEDVNEFVENVDSLDTIWRQRHGVNTDITAIVSALETDLDMLELRAPSELALAEYAAVLGQLVIRLVGGGWVAADEPYVITSDGFAVYPISQILKRAVDPDASLADWLKAVMNMRSL